MEVFFDSFREWSVGLLTELMPLFWAKTLQSIVAFSVILFVAWGVDKFATWMMRSYVPKIVGRTKNKWDDIFLENRVFANFAHFLPGIILAMFYFIIASEPLRSFLEHAIKVYFIVVFLLFVNALLNALNDIYATYTGQRAANIKIYLQVVKVALFSLGILMIISIFANKTFIDILTAMGAMVTILLIVYKDIIMGFIAGIQLSANKMLKVGDWISMPQNNADGTVLDISLSTVKVQNWDKTITTIPTYRLISESFSNWKGMEESAGRRIKRHVNINIDSIHFLSVEELERLKKNNLISSYIDEKVKELNTHNKSVNEDVDKRKLTNIGTFRKYIERYLENLGVVNLDMTFIVRQLQSTEKGVPIEIYMFSKEKEWAKYEAIQSDIFDHILAKVSDFNLKVFQNPTGDFSLKN